MIRKKESNAILQSLSGGVVPRTGLEHIIVGRRQETEQVMRELAQVRDGASVIKFFIGDFGSGKSFMLSIVRHIAFKEKFVVADVDFTPERRLYGGEGKAIATYSEFMKNLSTATRQDGGALQTIIEQWITNVQFAVQQENNLTDISYDDPKFVAAVKLKISSVLSQLEDLVGGFDFAKILGSYFDAYIQDNRHLQTCVLRWLRGEYATRTEARNDLGVRDIIDDQNWYDYLKLFSKFVTHVGYSGLVINFDEAINLYKISHAQTREKNYEIILSMFNDITQGKAEHMYVTYAGTSEFLEDDRRGLFSYEALKRRLVTNRFETAEFRDLAQPVIRLSTLRKEELFVLLQKITSIHSTHHNYQETITEQDLKGFLLSIYSRPGAEAMITPGEVVRDFIGALNVLHQNSAMDCTTIFKKVSDSLHQSSAQATNVLQRFQKTNQ
ncbi:ATP-binding protein [Paenibacillus thalictri]|uniref:Biotin carboxylase n=1 Tax=Paenibacillus thalictri TaxID=2527873 RepID=A0A4Q9DPQ2_9BACL|nr:ATP-binding protein [Paenibacillus thalictri]TBL76131.1 biotin carboxylase [Paenibacillus thalictri]